MRLPRSLVALAVLSLVAAACAKAEPTSHLAAQDLAPAEGEPFDANHILTLDELTDSSVTGELLRALISYRATEKTNRKNPYGRDSFLATYFSNGLSAIDALLNASEQYRINPLVLLVRAEMAEGLVALDSYPIDAPGGAYCFTRCNSNVSSSCRGGSGEWACCTPPTYPPTFTAENERVTQSVCTPADRTTQTCPK